MADQVTEEFVLTDEQRALRELVDDYAAKRWSEDRVRSVAEHGTPVREDLALLGADLGLLALAVPEAAGGGGAGLVEAIVVAERLGRVLAPVPYAGTTLALDLLTTVGRSDLAEPIASGARSVAVVATDEHGHWGSGALGVDSDRLTGTAAHVVDSPDADDLLVVVDGILYRVDAEAADIASFTTLDQTRPQATVRFDRSPGERLGEVDLAVAADRVLVCVAAESLGAAERLLAEATSYARTRIQFGRAIGSYQAVKHQLADLLVAVEQCRSLVEHAAWTHDHGGDDPALATSLARVHAAETLEQAAATSIQVHGGIGFTWEHHAHLYFKRAHSDAVLWGGLPPHRDRIARLALDEEVR